jgi:hypothetical protein
MERISCLSLVFLLTMRSTNFKFLRPVVKRQSGLTHRFHELTFVIVGPPLAALMEFNEVSQNAPSVCQLAFSNVVSRVSSDHDEKIDTRP